MKEKQIKEEKKRPKDVPWNFYFVCILYIFKFALIWVMVLLISKYIIYNVCVCERETDRKQTIYSAFLFLFLSVGFL